MKRIILLFMMLVFSLAAWAQLAAPTYSLTAGSYARQQLNAVTVPAGATLCFTTNGSNPTATTAGTCDANVFSFAGSGTFIVIGNTLNAPVTLKALATQLGQANSSVTTAVYTITGGCTANCGIGSDIPTGLMLWVNPADNADMHFYWNTVTASDSCMTTEDGYNNPWQWFCDQTAWTGVPANLVTAHDLHAQGVSVVGVGSGLQNPNAPPGLQFYLSSCTHASYASDGLCPMNSNDWSSSGPAIRNPSLVSPYILPRAPIPGLLSKLYLQTNAPSHVFQGSEVFFASYITIGAGVIDGTNPVRTLLQNVSYTDPVGVTHTCGSGGSYGNSAGTATCTGGPADSDFTFLLEQNPVYASGYPGFLFFYASSFLSTGVGGYWTNGWIDGGTFILYVKAGASLPAGNYSISYTYATAANNTGHFIAGLAQTITVPIQVEAVVPLSNNPPTSYPVWNFKGQFLAMASYWGTWNCANTTDLRGGSGPWAMFNNSGIFDNNLITYSNDTYWERQYDAGRFMMGMGDTLFSSTHSDWANNTLYKIGDLVTDSVSGTTFILNAVGGASSPGLSGTSGLSRPSFLANSKLGNTTGDNTLQWMSVGTADSWRSCALQATMTHLATRLNSQATIMTESGQFPVSFAMNAWRTGDSVPGDFTGYSYTENGTPEGGITGGIITRLPNETHNIGITETGTSTYWQGGGHLALSYFDSSLNLNVNGYTNAADLQTGRLKAMTLESMIADWMVSNDASWIGNSPNYQGARMLRYTNTVITMLDNLQAPTPLNQYFSGDPFYQYGMLAEALLHYYQATCWYSNKTLYPSSTVACDERIPNVLLRFAKWAWVNSFDRVYDKNQSAQDACYPGNSICQSTRRLHSYGFTYSYWSFSDAQDSMDFQTAASSNGELGWLYAWVYQRDHTLVPPDNHRNSVSNYFDAAALILQHSYDGMTNINACFGCTAGGSVSNWGVQDFYNGGRSTGAGYNQMVTGSKQVSQTAVNTVSEAWHWMDGTYAQDQGSLVPTTNKCWIVANRDATGYCGTPTTALPAGVTPSPYADTQAPAAMMGYVWMGGVNTSQPSYCIPGTTGNRVGSWCLLNQSVGGFAYNSNTLTDTTATITWTTIKNTVVGGVSTCKVDYGTAVGAPSLTTTETHTPALLTGMPLPLWSHSITLTNLTPNKLYHFAPDCKDSAGNEWRIPYVISATDIGPAGTRTYQIIGAGDQAPSFTTLQSTQSSLKVGQGVHLGVGVKVH